jgi:hypothetical protein
VTKPAKRNRVFSASCKNVEKCKIPVEIPGNVWYNPGGKNPNYQLLTVVRIYIITVTEEREYVY